MQHTLPQSEMSRVRLGKIARLTVSTLVQQGHITIPCITQILSTGGTHPPDVTMFTKQFTHPTGWWERRQEELSQEVFLHCLRGDRTRKCLVLETVARHIPHEDWGAFCSSCVKLALREPREAQQKFLEL